MIGLFRNRLRAVLSKLSFGAEFVCLYSSAKRTCRFLTSPGNADKKSHEESWPLLVWAHLIVVALIETQLPIEVLLPDLIFPGRTLVARTVEVDDIACAPTLEGRTIRA